MGRAVAVHQGSGWAWEEEQRPEMGLERTAGLACEQLHPAVTTLSRALIYGLCDGGQHPENWGDIGAAVLVVFPGPGDPGVQDQNML